MKPFCLNCLISVTYCDHTIIMIVFIVLTLLIVTKPSPQKHSIIVTTIHLLLILFPFITFVLISFLFPLLVYFYFCSKPSGLECDAGSTQTSKFDMFDWSYFTSNNNDFQNPWMWSCRSGPCFYLISLI